VDFAEGGYHRGVNAFRVVAVLLIAVPAVLAALDDWPLGLTVVTLIPGLFVLLGVHQVINGPEAEPTRAQRRGIAITASVLGVAAILIVSAVGHRWWGLMLLGVVLVGEASISSGAARHRAPRAPDRFTAGSVPGHIPIAGSAPDRFNARMRRIAALTLATALALAAAGPAGAQAPAALIVNAATDGPVTTAGIEACTSGQNLCTLRNAVAAVNQVANGTGIVFGQALTGATIALTQGSLRVTTATSIIGPGATALAIDGSAGVTDGIIADAAPSLTVSGLTLQNGSASDGLFDQQGGGAVQQTAGALTVSGIVFDGNTSGSGNDGGAIYADGGSTTVTDSTFTNNTASGGVESTQGGAIYLDSGTLSVTGSTFTGNTGVDGGGAIYGDGGAVTVSGATFTGNQATDAPADGGAIDIGSGTLIVTGSGFSANSATGAGTAINVATNTTATITGSHVTSNTGGAQAGPALQAINLVLGTTLVENNAATMFGGVVANTATLTNVTITGNQATGSIADCATSNACVGGLALNTGTLSGTTITGNTAGSGTRPNCGFTTTVTNGGGNQVAADCPLS
jgi:predicted outer membrane repeat protein